MLQQVKLLLMTTASIGDANADGTLIERSLVDVNAVDEAGKAVLDEDGNPVVTLGLKSQWKQNTKNQAASVC
jgi:hypothetical protein